MILAAILAASACKDPVSPSSFDPMALSTSATEAFGTCQNNQAVQSLDVMGSLFTFTGAPPAFPSAWGEAISPGLPATFRMLARAAAAFSDANPTALFPSTVLGKTFIYYTGTGRYGVSDRTGAPSNGVRFILYSVNPATRTIVTPLQEIGSVDLTDKGSNTLGVSAVV